MTKNQMSLMLPFESAMGREDFLPGASNMDAFTMIEHWPDWPSLWLLLAGPVGAGKSHLARIWQENSNARIVTLEELNAADPTRLVESGAVVVEDADRSVRDDRALFHLLNAAKEAGAYVLITARNWPDGWGVQLPDLASRLRLTTPVEIFEPDDQLLRQVLVKLFVDRQVVPDPSVVDYIVLRMERSIEAAIKIVEAIDREALARRKNVTRPIAIDVMKKYEHGELG